MVGVPESSFENWANKFVAKGYKVGRVEQTETNIQQKKRMTEMKGKKVNVFYFLKFRKVKILS
jgi:DNA mismatch repair protein MSH6